VINISLNKITIDQFKLLVIFIIIWFFRGFLIGYVMGKSLSSIQENEPLLIKILFEGGIVLTFISVLNIYRFPKSTKNIVFIGIAFFSWSCISAYINEISFINAIKYSRYFIYSILLYFIGRTVRINKSRIKKLVRLFYWLMLIQIIVSVLNIIFYGPNESRIGTVFLVSGELGTILPLTFLGFFISYYHLVSKRKIHLILGWLLLMISFSTGKRTALIVFPMAYIVFEYYCLKLLSIKSLKQFRNVIKASILLVFMTPFLIFLFSNTDFGGFTPNVQDNFDIKNISKAVNYAMEYTKNEKSGYSTGRISTNIKLWNSLYFRNNLLFGIGSMKLYDRETRGYGSGFTKYNILYGIPGWGRDYISLGLPSVFLMFWFIYILHKRYRKILRLKKNIPNIILSIILGCYFALFIFLFDYLFYSSVTFVSGIPLFIITLGLGISENYTYNFVKYRRANM